jgi:hypothetical protein
MRFNCRWARVPHKRRLIESWWNGDERDYVYFFRADGSSATVNVIFPAAFQSRYRRNQ